MFFFLLSSQGGNKCFSGVNKTTGHVQAQSEHFNVDTGDQLTVGNTSSTH